MCSLSGMLLTSCIPSGGFKLPLLCAIAMINANSCLLTWLYRQKELLLSLQTMRRSDMRSLQTRILRAWIRILGSDMRVMISRMTRDYCSGTTARMGTATLLALVGQTYIDMLGASITRRSAICVRGIRRSSHTSTNYSRMRSYRSI